MLDQILKNSTARRVLGWNFAGCRGRIKATGWQQGANLPVFQLLVLQLVFDLYRRREVSTDRMAGAAQAGAYFLDRLDLLVAFHSDLP